MASISTVITDLDNIITNFVGDGMMFSSTTASDITFTTNTIGSEADLLFTNFHDGDSIVVSNSASNDGTYEVASVSANGKVITITTSSLTGGSDTGVDITVDRNTGFYDSDEFHLDTINKRFYFKGAGNLAANGTGVTGQALYSMFKKQWKDVPSLTQYDFPMLSITNEQFEFIDGYRPDDGFTVPGAGGSDITFADANPDTITSATINFTTQGVKAGDLISINNSTSNDGQYRVLTVSGTTITLDASESLVAAAPDTANVEFYINRVEQAGSEFTSTRKMIRTAGWSEVNADSTVNRRYSGVVSLGALEPTDQPYYIQSGKLKASTTSTTYSAEVNEPVQIYGDSASDTDAVPSLVVTGSSDISFDNTGIITDAGNGLYEFNVGDVITVTGTTSNNTDYTVTSVAEDGGSLTVTPVTTTESNTSAVLTRSAFDYTSTFKMFVRTRGKTYVDSELADIGVTTMTTIVYRFPLTNITDLNITTSADTEIDANSDGTADVDPYDQLTVTYYDVNILGTVSDTTYAVDDVVQENNGAGSRWFKCTGAGTVTGSTSVPQSSWGGTATWTAYTEGEREVETGTYSAYKIIVDANDDLVAVPGTVTRYIIYERLQFELRRAATFDTGTSRNGDITDLLATFTGDVLYTAAGVFIDAFASSDTNLIIFTDYNSVTHAYPTVVNITFNFNQYLANDTNAIYRAFYKSVPNGQFGQANAITLVNSSSNPVANTVPQAGAGSGSSTSFNYSYTSDTTGGRTGDTPTDIVVVAIGLGTGQYVAAEGTITSSGLSVSLVAPQERNYSNPA